MDRSRKIWKIDKNRDNKEKVKEVWKLALTRASVLVFVKSKAKGLLKHTHLHAQRDKHCGA